MTSATVPDSHADLLQAPQATLATVGPDGRPQMTSVWFLAEDGRVRFSLNTNRQKTKNLQANPVIGVHIQDATNGGRYLEVRGDARIEPDDDYVFADRVGAKYGGVDLRAMDAGQGRRVVVTVEPVRVNAIDLERGLRLPVRSRTWRTVGDATWTIAAELVSRAPARRHGRRSGGCPRSGRRDSDAPSARRGRGARSTGRPRARGSRRPAHCRAGSWAR